MFTRLRKTTTFQSALLRLVLGSLVLTVGGIGAAVYYNSNRAIESVKRQHYQLVSLTVAREVQDFFRPAYLTLLEMQSLGGRGLLPLDDPQRLGALFAERVRYVQTLSWLSYSDLRTGRFIGVWRRDDGAIVLNESSPEENGGHPRETVLFADGTTAPLERNLPGGYDPRTKPWFQGALHISGVFWSDVYTFTEGERGISASLQCFTPGRQSEPQGVFTADFFLHDITSFLSRVDPSHRRIVIAMMPTGEVFGVSSNFPFSTDAVIRRLRELPPQEREKMHNGKLLRVNLEFVGANGAKEHGEVGFSASTVDGSFQLITGIGSPDSEFLGAVQANARWTLCIGVGALLLAAAASVLFTRRLARTLEIISRDLENVGRFQLTATAWTRTSLREIETVHASVDRMKAGLRSFGHYVPRHLVRELLSHGMEARLGGEMRELTVLFSDIAGFTGIAEQMAPTQLVEYLGDYLEMVTASLEANGGTLDKFMGDGALAFFNAPVAAADHATRACRAAWEIQCALECQEVAGRDRDAPPVLHTRIGLHTGEVLVGNIGTRERFAYTIIGDAVNLASRLESLNKIYGTRVLASEATRAQAGEAFEWRRLDRVAVYGRAAGTLVFELLGSKGEVADSLREARDVYERGLSAYFARDFHVAADWFQQAKELRPSDLAADLLAGRSRALSAQTVPASWNGVYVAAQK
ncbi:MAG: hypothetical protein JO295_06820 [Verrucomicrobia bacterium]|nr:hypothetical protein [Verrucomicrobiota bacterium]